MLNGEGIPTLVPFSGFGKAIVLFCSESTRLNSYRIEKLSFATVAFWLQLMFTRYEPSRSIPIHWDGSYSVFSLCAIWYPFPALRLRCLSTKFPRTAAVDIAKIFLFQPYILYYTIFLFIKQEKIFIYEE